MRFLALIFLALALSAPADARSARAKYQFQKANPCPMNGAHRGRCPGYQIDHAKALCAGGADHPDNMQWLTVEEHRVKTKRDVFECRILRRERGKR